MIEDANRAWNALTDRGRQALALIFAAVVALAWHFVPVMETQTRGRGGAAAPAGPARATAHHGTMPQAREARL